MTDEVPYYIVCLLCSLQENNKYLRYLINKIQCFFGPYKKYKTLENVYS